MKIASNRNECCNQLVHFFRILQRLNRFVTEDMNSDLSIVESLLLYELDGDATRSVTELAEQMELDKATVSRTLKNLAEKKILRIGKDVNDARRITVEITARGHATIETNDYESNNLLNWYLRFLTKDEATKIENYFRITADAFGTATTIVRKNDHPIRAQLRRLAKSLGYLKDVFMETSYSPAEWQVIAAIQVAEEPIPPTYLAQVLATPSSFVSRLLGGLATKGIVRRPRSSLDSRSRELSLTTKGKEVFFQIEKSFRDMLIEKLHSLSERQLTEYAEIFALFVREFTDGVRLVSRDFYCKLLTSEEERRIGRGYLIKEAVNNSLQNMLPESICSAGQVSVGLYKKQVQQGILLLQPMVGNDKLQTQLWIASESLASADKEVWLAEASALIADTLKGFSPPVSIDISSYIGNL